MLRPSYPKNIGTARDEAFTNVAAGIARTVRDLHEQRDKPAREAAATPKKDSTSHITTKEGAATRRARDPFFEDMVLVGGGSFQMGSDQFNDEKPVHTVIVPSFYISKYPVTQGQWQKVMGNNPAHFKGDERLPVESVNWYDVQEFLKKLNKRTGQQYRLPSEAEWEYAARGGQKSKGYEYAGSNNLDEVGWYSANSGSKTHPVGQKKANELGLHDMSDNVWEWCEDDWHNSYKEAPKGSSAWVDDPRGASRVFRGGSWSFNAISCRAAYRFPWPPTHHYIFLGFRFVVAR